MSDAVLFVGMVLAFAVGVTAHAAIVYGLASQLPRWRAIAALVIAPLAPYWAFRERMRIRGAMWVVAVLAYAVARILSNA